MGLKYRLSFLMNDDNNSIMKKISEILSLHGWKYNYYSKGECQHWLEAPMFYFGETEKIIERQVNKNGDGLAILLREHQLKFSPIIKLSKMTGFLMDITLYISENNGDWKEVGIFFDKYDYYDSKTDLEKKELYHSLLRLFKQLAKDLGAYYGIAAIEANGLVSLPENLSVTECIQLGDFNYFSDQKSIVISDKISKRYQLESLTNGGILLINKEEKIHYV